MSYDHEELWDAINAYAVSIGGEPTKRVYGNIKRQEAVARIEQLLGYPSPRPPEPEFILIAHGAWDPPEECENGLTPKQVERKKGQLFAFVTESRHDNSTGTISMYGHESDPVKLGDYWHFCLGDLYEDGMGAFLDLDHSEHGPWTAQWAKWRRQQDGEWFPAFFPKEEPGCFPVMVASWWDGALEAQYSETRKERACQIVGGRWPDVKIINVYDKFDGAGGSGGHDVQVYFRPPGFRSVVLCEPLVDPNVATPAKGEEGLWEDYVSRLYHNEESDLWFLKPKTDKTK